MAVVWITGAAGFLGRWVVNHLLTERDRDPNQEIILLDRRPRPAIGGARALVVDLADFAAMGRLAREEPPEIVLHLAGLTPPAAAEAFYQANTWATLSLIHALKGADRPTRLVMAGSAAELGPVPVECLPANESLACHPRDAYGMSKLLATTAVLACSSPLEPVVARLFNPIGPGLPDTQAFGRFASLLATPGVDPLVLEVGDLESRRDFIDARDVAAALVTLTREGTPGGLYHVGTGRSHSVREGLDRLIELSGRAVDLRIKPDRHGGQGPSDSRADLSKILSTSWRPRFAFEQSLDDLWRARVEERG